MGTIGGYRVVRRLGTGSRSEVWLGRAAAEAKAHEDGTAEPIDDALVAVKVFRPEVDLGAIDREIQALVRTRSRHVARLIDASLHAPDGTPCIVLPRLDQGGLARLLAERERLSDGEVATLLIPIARAVTAMHAAGVAHGQVEPRKILFDDHGAPVLVGGARMSVANEPPSRLLLRESECYLEDRRCLYELATSVATRARPEFGFLGSLESDAWRSPDFPESLVDLAFDTAPPEPVALPWREDAEEHRMPRTSVASVEGRRQSPSRRHPVLSNNTSEPETVRPIERLAAVKETLIDLRSRAIAVAGTVRPRYRVLAVACTLLVALALGFTARDAPPAASRDADSQAEPSAFESSVMPPGEATESAPDPSQETTTNAELQAALTDDDPVVAAHALLAERAKCLSNGSAECLASVLQDGSALWASDHALIETSRHAQVDAPLSDDIASLAVVDTMGGVVLLRAEPPAAQGESDATTAASVLIVRTEAGWRIRDVFV